MNRHERRVLLRHVKPGGLAVPAPESVALTGGPMDGWVVKPDAPALRADWYRTWPDAIAGRFEPGSYGPVKVTAGVRRSRWQAGVHA